METKEIVELMLKSSDHNPYTGMLSKKDNLISAIDLAKLCKDFADKGQTDEAMNIPSEQWVVVISKLEGMSHLKTQNQLNEATENLNISDVISSLTLEDITKIVNAFTDINIPIEAVREEIELNYL